MRTATPRSQQGAMLIIALIVLVAMSLAGIAMMRSVDTGTLVAGNIAFKQSSLHATDHGLQAASGAWSNHCAKQARAWRVPFVSLRVNVPRKRGESPEAAARTARYAALADAMKPGEVLVTAQHLNDQAETLLLQLFREAILSDASMPPVPINPRFQIRNDYVEVTNEDVFDRYPSALLELFVVIEQPRDCGRQCAEVVDRHDQPGDAANHNLFDRAHRRRDTWYLTQRRLDQHRRHRITGTGRQHENVGRSKHIARCLNGPQEAGPAGRHRVGEYFEILSRGSSPCDQQRHVAEVHAPRVGGDAHRAGRPHRDDAVVGDDDDTVLDGRGAAAVNDARRANRHRAGAGGGILLGGERSGREEEGKADRALYAEHAADEVRAEDAGDEKRVQRDRAAEPERDARRGDEKGRV